MFRIGLTGGIGSGKTTVANLFAQLNVPIIDADLITKKLTMPSTPAYTAITQQFGPFIIDSDKTLDRKKLRELIFTNTHSKKWLENLLHPLIKDSISHEIASLTSPYCIIVIPLLIETKSYDLVNRVLVIETDEIFQLQRAAQRDQVAQTQIKKIIQSQASKAQRRLCADDLIYNNGDRAELTRQVQKLHEKYLQMESLKAQWLKKGELE